jgi:Mce-associated membrane protein
VTVVLDTDQDTTPAQPIADDCLAGWWARAGAFALDVLLASAVVATMALVWVTAPAGGWLWWVLISTAALTSLLTMVNRWLLPAVTALRVPGWTLGRALFAITVVGRDGGPVGPWRLLARDFGHLLDTAALFVGWLWPLWDARHRTLADLLLRTEVRRTERPQRDVRRLTAVVLLVATAMCVGAVGLGYLVYRDERAINQARDQIAVQGPRIVEQVLNYNVDTLQDDFKRAQSVVTDSYKAQLQAQQLAVQKAGATTNEYWAVSSAVLSVSADRASMLLAMQGQRGSDPAKLRFITATVRVNFEKSQTGNWLLADLSVLKKPALPAAPTPAPSTPGPPK